MKSERINALGIGVAAIAAVALFAAPAVARDATLAVLHATPSAAVAETLKSGKTDIGDGAIAYRPAGSVRGALLLLHGAGQKPGPLVEEVRPWADRHGLVLLGVRSAGSTWDLTGSLDRSGHPLAMKIKPRPRFGRDPERINAALTRLFAQIPVDPRKTVIAGFSDGASVALSIGLANPQLFSGIVAMSPGMVQLPDQGIMSQRIVIVHGVRDAVLPFLVARRDIVGLLERVGYRPTLLSFDGDHRIDSDQLDKALTTLFGKAG